MITPEEVVVSLYKRPDEFKDFQCEKTGYSDFVQKPEEAKKYYDDNFGVTYVFKLKANKQPVGFVTLAMSALPRKLLSKEQKKKKPFGNVPSLLLGHMARDQRFLRRRSGASYGGLGKATGCRTR